MKILSDSKKYLKKVMFEKPFDILNAF